MLLVNYTNVLPEDFSVETVVIDSENHTVDARIAEDLLAMMGASLAMMDVMNVRIEREIRNQENRATNCVAKNIEKSVSAAARQMAAIEKLTVTGMLAQLPESVRATALLRAENPDATLEELRNLHGVKKPLMIMNFLERLDESINIQDLLERTSLLKRQVLLLTI